MPEVGANVLRDCQNVGCRRRLSEDDERVVAKPAKRTKGLEWTVEKYTAGLPEANADTYALIVRKVKKRCEKAGLKDEEEIVDIILTAFKGPVREVLMNADLTTLAELEGELLNTYGRKKVGDQAAKRMAKEKWLGVGQVSDFIAIMRGICQDQAELENRPQDYYWTVDDKYVSDFLDRVPHRFADHFRMWESNSDEKNPTSLEKIAIRLVNTMSGLKDKASPERTDHYERGGFARRHNPRPKVCVARQSGRKTESRPRKFTRTRNGRMVPGRLLEMEHLFEGACIICTGESCWYHECTNPFTCLFCGEFHGTQEHAKIQREWRRPSRQTSRRTWDDNENAHGSTN
ncbi:hypothetical protein SNEBB_007959 [Seison nebaliae]|nr:hypothetical protein SNEBB_007959 [Seison nebaliae]